MAKQVLAIALACLAMGLSLLFVTNEDLLFDKSELPASPPTSASFYSDSGAEAK
ncbi:hypothetical protein WMW72_26845 [Paenibacillus filicis]|uniref:Uncharacterized protein n=1 Tax=Paenibacillus filicis TaxID=669464 RepID=A0ABU9DTM5_9BACL